MRTIKLDLSTARKVEWELKKAKVAHTVEKGEFYYIECSNPPESVKHFF